ncbi:MAG: glycoside hydrolase family 2 protein, partial [Armatimonadota bacterium]|nr:glycoside hydrolase family 2 protein [Armatimonadota bacterium]
PLVRRADADGAMVEVLVDLMGQENTRANLEVTLTAPDGAAIKPATSAPTDSGSVRVTVKVPTPQLWWPRGYGEQPLYDLNVKLSDARSGALLDEWSSRIGLRTVRLNTEKDEIGTKFILEVNGRPIFCKGANWIPDDCFLNRVDEARYRRRIEQALAANMNMLRIWGGGIYETEAFYRLCDELGVLVWQDFLFACAAYPEEPPFDQLVEVEARYNITRLSKHPSLVLWNGCNENIWGYFDWGWKPKVEGRTWGLGFYLDLLPKLMSEIDPTRPYWPGSPYSGSMEIHPNDDRHANMHIWDAWNQVDYTIYRAYSPRFSSEFGHQAPPTYATLQKSIPADQLSPDSPAMLHHQKANGGNDKLNNRLAEHFEIPADFDDWLYLTQVNQARAVQTGVEWFRSRQPRCMGSLYWQINDCWPVTSWAAIDGYGRFKPLWYATRRFYADRLLTIQPEGDHLALYAVNDTDETWSSDLILARLTFNGQHQSEKIGLEVGPRSCRQVLELDPAFYAPGNAANEFLLARADDACTTWFFDIDQNLNYPEPAFDAELTSDGSIHRLTITAHSLLRDVAIFVDRLDAEATINDQLVTLLPGESFMFVIESGQALTREALTAPPVFQCANRFGRGL